MVTRSSRKSIVSIVLGAFSGLYSILGIAQSITYGTLQGRLGPTAISTVGTKSFDQGLDEAFDRVLGGDDVHRETGGPGGVGGKPAIGSEDVGTALEQRSTVADRDRRGDFEPDRALEMLKDKRDTNPAKKHTNIPL